MFKDKEQKYTINLLCHYQLLLFSGSNYINNEFLLHLPDAI